MAKYLIIPGEVQSQYDGDIHYISAERLIRLYEVDPADCIIDTFNSTIDTTGLIRLRPRHNGDYTLPKD